MRGRGGREVKGSGGGSEDGAEVVADTDGVGCQHSPWWRRRPELWWCFLMLEMAVVVVVVVVKQQ